MRGRSVWPALVGRGDVVAGDGLRGDVVVGVDEDCFAGDLMATSASLTLWPWEKAGMVAARRARAERCAE